MVATFNAALSSQRDRLRFALGDTDTEAPLLPDETYDAALEQQGSYPLAGALLAEALAARYAQEPDSVAISGELTVSWRVRVQTWLGLAAKWRAEAARLASGLRSREAERDWETTPEYARWTHEETW